MRRHHVIFFLHTDNLMGNFRHGAQREFLTRKMLNISPLVGLFAWCSPSTPQNAKDIPRWIVYDVYQKDGWTVVTRDKKLSAQWEHTVAVTANGFEVLTLRDDEQSRIR